MFSALLTTLLLVPALAAPVEMEERDGSGSGSGNSTHNVKEFIAELYAQVNPNDRNTLLDGGFTFDFLAAESFGGGGRDGGLVLADNTLFPGVVGNGLSWLVGFLGVSRPPA